jgi:hypothetical protein
MKDGKQCRLALGCAQNFPAPSAQSPSHSFKPSLPPTRHPRHGESDTPCHSFRHLVFIIFLFIIVWLLGGQATRQKHVLQHVIPHPPKSFIFSCGKVSQHIPSPNIGGTAISVHVHCPFKPGNVWVSCTRPTAKLVSCICSTKCTIPM